MNPENVDRLIGIVRVIQLNGPARNVALGRAALARPELLSPKNTLKFIKKS
jgi:hypothetical protein